MILAFSVRRVPGHPATSPPGTLAPWHPWHPVTPVAPVGGLLLLSRFCSWRQRRAGRSSNGRTADSDSAYRGSNPCLPATHSHPFVRGWSAGLAGSVGLRFHLGRRTESLPPSQFSFRTTNDHKAGVCERFDRRHHRSADGRNRPGRPQLQGREELPPPTPRSNPRQLFPRAPSQQPNRR